MPLLGKAACRVFLMFPLPCMQQILVYPKSMGCLSYCSPSFCYKSYCFFFELPIMFPMPLALFHFTPPKVMWLYCKPNLSVCPLFRGKCKAIAEENAWQTIEALRHFKNKIFFASITEKTRRLF